MFLAIKEMKHSKIRYALVAGVIFLIAYLVFFLTGLAYGLAQDNRTAVDKWDATTILLSKESNDNLNMSMFSKKLIDEVSAEKKAVLAQVPAVVRKNENEKISVSFFGIENQQFLAPNIIKGRQFKTDDEVVGDISLKKQYGLALGDTLSISGNTKKVKLVGFTDQAKFNVSPVLYTTISAYQQIRFQKQDNTDTATINAIIIQGNLKEYPKNQLGKLSINKFINELPGYSAQVLTFGFMIGFLIVIAAIVIGIFIYVLTMQKVTIFGVMKAQGISSGFISWSVVVQTFLLAFIGVAIGGVTTILTSFLLPDAVPFQVNYWFFLGISVLMILFAVLGAFFSVRAIVKIDPLKAIG